MPDDVFTNPSLPERSEESSGGGGGDTGGGGPLVPVSQVEAILRSAEEMEADRRRWEEWYYSQEPPPEEEPWEDPPPEEEPGPAPAAETVPPPWAYDKGLIRHVKDDLRKVGIVGEVVNAFVLYLIATSRILKNPLGGLLMGASSAGKSFLIDKIYDLMPAAGRLRATDITPQALYYVDFELSHKFIAGGERCRKEDDSTAQRTAAMRQMRSEGRLHKWVTVNRDGEQVAVEIVKEGPIAYIESTTQKKAVIFPEDLNRGLILKMNDSPGQTRKVKAREADDLACECDGEPVDVEDIQRQHQQYQAALQPYPVRIPYMRAVADYLPDHDPKFRRVVKQVGGLIQVIALLHQFQEGRPWDTDEDGNRVRMVATLADYAAARGLLLDALREATLTEKLESLYRALAKQFKPGEAFDTSQAVALVKSAKTTLRKHLQTLAGLKLLRCVQAGKGQTATRWQLTDRTLADFTLPTVERVAEVWQAKQPKQPAKQPTVSGQSG
jgi:hypothetical protein